MKWSSVKNILLGMLIVMNAFVICSLLIRRMNTENIPPVVLSAAVDTFGREGISCDEALLTARYITAEKPTVRFYTPTELSKMFFASQRPFQSDGTALVTRSGSAELTVDGETFAYKSGGQSVPATEKELRRALKKLGLDMAGAKYSSEQNLFCRYQGGHPLFGIYIRAELDGDGSITAVEARWPRISPSGDRETGINIISLLPDIGEAFPGGGTVKRVRFGYSLARRGGTDVYELQPAWRVTLEDGRSRIFRQET